MMLVIGLDVEYKRRLSEKNIRAYNAREKMQAVEVHNEQERLRSRDEEWSRADR